jgi:hypothetical protein
MDNRVTSSDIANFLGENPIGEKITINKISAIDKIEAGSISFINKTTYEEDLNANSLIIIPFNKEIKYPTNNTYIKHKN